jgi:hypothetical protein
MKHVTWPLAAIVLTVVLALMYFNERGIHELQKVEPVLVGIYANLTAASRGAYSTSPHSLVSFWTPSTETARALTQAETSGEVVPARDEWQRTVGESTINAFGKELGKLEGVEGWRRFADVGKGRTFVKPGYWWQVTTGSSFRLDRLRELYHGMCGCEDTYIEVIAASDSSYARLTGTKKQ